MSTGRPRAELFAEAVPRTRRPAGLLSSLLLERSYRARNVLSAARAHPWDTARLAGVTAVLLGAAVAAIPDVARTVAASVERHPLLAGTVAWALLAWMLTAHGIAVARRHFETCRTGWRSGFPFTTPEKRRAVMADTLALTIPTLLTFWLLSERLSEAATRAGVVGLLAGVLVLVIGATWLETRRRMGGDWERAPSGKAPRTQRHVRVDPRSGGALLLWRSARAGVRGLLGELILRERAAGGASVADRWGTRTLITCSIVFPLAIARGELAIVAIPLATLLGASFPPPARLFWVCRALPMSFGLVFTTHLAAGVRAVWPLWLGSLLVAPFSGARLAVVGGVALAAVLLSWQALVAFAFPFSKLGRALVSAVAALGAATALLTPFVWPLVLLAIALLFRRARSAFGREDLEVPA